MRIAAHFGKRVYRFIRVLIAFVVLWKSRIVTLTMDRFAIKLPPRICCKHREYL